MLGRFCQAQTNHPGTQDREGKLIFIYFFTLLMQIKLYFRYNACMLGEELDHMGDLRPFWDDIYHPVTYPPRHMFYCDVVVRDVTGGFCFPVECEDV